MSLSWHERLHALIAPTHVGVEHVPRWKRAAVSHVALEVPGAQPGWEGAVQALAEHLGGLPSRGARCHFVLSNHFCRYALVPGDAGLSGAAEIEAYARLRLDAVYGAGASAPWTISISRMAGQAPRLACAIDAALLDALRAACASAHAVLVSVRPLLAAAFDGTRGRVSASRFWFAAAEEGRLCLAAIDRGTWRSVACGRTVRDVPVELDAMLARALVSDADMRGEPVYLYGADAKAADVHKLRGVILLDAPRESALPGRAKREEAAA